MKKIIAISFLFIFLCANTEIGQLFKLSNLFEHFTDHHDHDTDHDISFLDFVKSHYDDTHKHSNNDQHEEHKNLPFKTINTNINTVFAFENQSAITFRIPIGIDLNNKFPFHKEFYTSNVYNCIWLPPKLS